MPSTPTVQDNSRIDPRSKTWFKPGQSGNPSGRPKGAQSYAEIIRSLGSKRIRDIDAIPEELKRQLTIDNKDLTIKEALVYSATLRALAGDKHALDFVADREEGRAPETIKITDDRVIIDIDDDEESDEEVLEHDSYTDNSNCNGNCDGSV